MSKLTTKNLKILDNFNKKMKKKDTDVYSTMPKNSKPIITKKRTITRAPSIAPKPITKAHKKTQAEQNQALQKEINSKESKISTLTTENQKLIEDLNNQKNETNARIQEKDAEIENLNQEFESQQKKIQDLEQIDISDLQREIDLAKRKSAEKDEEISKLEKMISDIKIDIKKELNNQLEKIQAKKNKKKKIIVGLNKK